MRAQQIVDQLSKVLPNFTSGFSNSLTLTSATVAGSTVTATTDGPHDLEENQNVAISGVTAPVQIDVASFARVGSSATFETTQQHDLTLSERDKAAGDRTVTLSGAAEPEFNGEFQLIGVPNRNKLIIAVDDSGPTTISGSPLVDNANGAIFNGLVAATNLTADTFEYELPEAYPLDGIVVSAVVQVSIRILAVLDIEQYLEDVYTAKSINDDVLVVQLGDVIQSKSRDEETDAATSSSAQYAYTPILIQPFALYIIQNTTDQLAGAAARDKVESEYIPAIFSSVLLSKFDTGFSYSGFEATFTGHGVFAYSGETGKNKAIYAHEVTFEQLVQVTRADTVEAEATVAMRDVEYTLTTDLGTGELLANVNLDDDAEPEL